jgi:SAM-dependent methyltransferase
LNRSTDLRRRAEPWIPPDFALHAVEDAIRSLHGAMKHAEWFETYVKRHRNRLAFDVAHAYERLSRGGRGLDVGCNPPVLMLALQSLGCQMGGIDLDPERFEKAIVEHRLDVTKANVEGGRLPFESRSFSLVMFNEVFEHLRINPIETMTEIFRILDDGGELYLSTPNVKSALGYVNFLLRDRLGGGSADPFAEFKKLETLGHMGHVREYTVSEVTSFLSRVGFSVKDVIYRGRYSGAAARVVLSAMPQLRPHFTVIAERPVVARGAP